MTLFVYLLPRVHDFDSCIYLRSFTALLSDYAMAMFDQARAIRAEKAYKAQNQQVALHKTGDSA